MASIQKDWLQHVDPILTVEDVAARLNVTKDWVWDHSSRSCFTCGSFE